MLENSILVPTSAQPGWFPGRSRFLGVDARGWAVVIPLSLKTLGPHSFDMEEIDRAISDGLLKIEAPTQGQLSVLAPGDMSKRVRANYDLWEPHVAPLLQGDRRDELLEESRLLDIVTGLAEATKKPIITARRMLYRVLRAGRSLRGLGLNFRSRGGPGKPQAKGTAKRGRKSLPGSLKSHVAITEVRPILEAAVLQHVVKLKEAVDTAYYKMLGEFFTETVCEANGIVRSNPYEETRRPSLAQFRRVAKQVTEGGPLSASKQAKRARPGTAKDGIPGPGYRYEIDATGGRLELVSEFDLSQSIGPANAYGLIDVWSTACVGGAMGAFNAGYQAAQVALFNAFTDKQNLCARWDIQIAPAAWPCEHVPRLITSDRGELVSDASEALPQELNVVAQVAPPYRPDLKGTIERWFKDLKAGDIRKLVGFGRKLNRGERDPKDQAALTRYDAMRAFLILAIRHNNQPAPLSAIPPEMLEQGYERISRITLWQWGLLNLVSGARTEDPRVIYTSLLRKVESTIRENGLFVEGIRYMSPELRASGLLQRAAQRGALTVQATVDDFAANVVWYRTDLDAPWLPAYLADEKLKMYNATFAELADYYRRLRTVHQRTRVYSAASDLAAEDALKGISKDAVTRQGTEKKKSKQAKNVRAARAVDAQDERREHGAQVLGSYVRQKKQTIVKRPKVASDGRNSKRLGLAREAFLNAGKKSS